MDGLGVQAIEEPHSLRNETVALSGGGSTDALVTPARGQEGEVDVGRVGVWGPSQRRGPGSCTVHRRWPGWMGPFL